MILQYYSALLKLHLECSVLFWVPQHQRDLDIPEGVQQRTTLWNISLRRDAERTGTVQSGKEEAQGTSYPYMPERMMQSG